MSALRKLLDFLYLAAGVLAALCLISILSLIVLLAFTRKQPGFLWSHSDRP